MKKLPKRRTNERLLKQNFTVAKIASGALYLTILSLFVTVLKIRQMPDGLYLSFDNKPLVIAIATGTPFLLNMAIIIYHIKKYLSNFTEDRGYKVFFNLSFICMVIFICAIILYGMLDNKVLITIILITLCFTALFWLLALRAFSNNQTYEDFIGNIYILTKGYDYYDDEIRTGNQQNRRNLFNILTKPFMLIEVFEEAQSYSYSNGYRQE